MLKMTKLTDYALVIMADIDRQPDGLAQIGDIALNTRVAKPTAAKLLTR